MEWVEVRDRGDVVVWRSPEAERVVVDRTGDTIKVFDLDSSQVIGGYELRPGERPLKQSSAGR